MTVYRLTKELVFPPPELADDDGLLAIGGDLSVDRLVLAYSMGIFPWYSDYGEKIWQVDRQRGDRRYWIGTFPRKVSAIRYCELRRLTYQISMNEVID